MRFKDIASGLAFDRTPELAWGFYGHRLNLYRETTPHAGFGMLLDLARNKPRGAFVYTSNVDGQFQKAGFEEDKIVECHGSIHHLQCTKGCSEILPAIDLDIEVDHETCLVTSTLPRCSFCGHLARPNILMFSDTRWIESRTDEQLRRFEVWRSSVSRLITIELGAGTAIPTVRRLGETQYALMIRINPFESRVGSSLDVSLPCGAKAGLEAIMSALDALDH